VTRFVLVTGTDTSVGKTVVAAGLARCLVRLGRPVLAVKPVESGCGLGPREAEDGALLAEATGQIEPREALTRLAKPVAPPLAASAEGVVLDPRGWCDEIRRLAAGRDVVLVEGAGGLLSPLAPDFNARDLARELGASAFVVATDRLGCLNHVLLTVEALRSERVPLSGVVLSAPAEPDESTGTNGAALREVLASPRVLELPRLSRPEEAPDHLIPAGEWLEEDG
jgi:dethiobiotin synthetase